MKKLFILLIFVMPVTCFAITVYDIKYNFSNNTAITYQAFLVRYDQNGGFIRVKFTNTQDQSVSLVNMDFTEEFQTDKLYLIFKGANPKYLKGNGQYNPDHFWFRKNDNDGKYYSYGINSPGSDGKFTDGTILSMKLLDVGVLTRDYVLNFFDSNEPFYKNLFAEAPALTTNLTEVPKFHLILAANTLDESIGVSCLNSQTRELEYFRNISSQAGMLFNPKIISGLDFNKSNLLSAIDNLKPGKNDVVVFYYNGHGFRYSSDTDPYPRLAMTTENNSIGLSDVYFKIKAKNARLSLVIGDCCNSNIDQPPTLAAGGAVTASSPNVLSSTNCAKLFLNSKGNIIATSATKGESALYDMNIGGVGFFSKAFMNSLDIYLSTFSANPSWNDILKDAQKKTSFVSNYAICEDYPKCKHVPVFNIEESALDKLSLNIIKPNNKISATINKLWIEHGATENSVSGMRIHIGFNINNYKGKIGYCSAYFYTSDGIPLKDINKTYNAANGNVATSQRFIPPFENTVFNDYTLFIPYAELHRAKGYYDLKLNVEIHSVDGTKFNSLVISGYQYFTFTQP